MSLRSPRSRESGPHAHGACRDNKAPLVPSVWRDSFVSNPHRTPSYTVPLYTSLPFSVVVGREHGGTQGQASAPSLRYTGQIECNDSYISSLPLWSVPGQYRRARTTTIHFSSLPEVAANVGGIYQTPYTLHRHRMPTRPPTKDQITMKRVLL